MNRPKSRVEQSLRQKGFSDDTSHHRFFVYITKDGRVTSVFTKTSHTPKAKDLDDYLLGQMAKQCRISRKEFIDLVDCPLSRDDYEAKLNEAGLIE